MITYLVAAACAVGIVFLAALMTRKAKGVTDDPAPDGPTTGFTGAMLSALFLLAFAIAIVVPWTTNDAARLNTYTESQAVAEAAWAATDLPDAEAAQVQEGLRGYVEFVRGTEWRLMADGRLSQEGWTRLEQIRRDVSAWPAKTTDDKDTQAGVLDEIGEITSARRQRAMDAQAVPPSGLLVVTGVSGLIVLLFPFLAGARPRAMTLVPLGLMAALLGIGMYLTLDISHAFAGSLAVRPDAFTGVLEELQRVSGSG
ncbi:hypothetical protein [Spirillospora sp. NPDC047279]|uniref:bestrophin-like domain n=1 Tax=Spirillospora sp. NPDC047279 TaxID=3155478 RepID=UPI0033FB2F14